MHTRHTDRLSGNQNQYLKPSCGLFLFIFFFALPVQVLPTEEINVMAKKEKHRGNLVNWNSRQTLWPKMASSPIAVARISAALII